MISDTITYFQTPGNHNFDDVITIIKDYLSENSSVKNVVVFAGRTASVFKLHHSLSEYAVSISVATYAFNRKFPQPDASENEERYIIPDVTTRSARDEIIESGMNYLQGGLPFEPILSCTGDNATEMIVSAYETISKGLPLCISAAVMAFENGILEENEKVLACTGDTAVLVTPTIRRELFCGGFKIHRILCMPE